MTDRLRIGVLAGLVVLWGGVLAVRLLTVEEPARVPLKHQTGQVQTAVADPGVTGLPRLLEQEARKRTEPAAANPVNIFAPLEIEAPEPSPAARQERLVRPRPTAARPRSAVTAEYFGPERPAATGTPSPPPQPSPDELAVQQARQQQELAAQQARQRLGQYRYLGYLSEEGEHRAFLGKGRELYIVRTGETVDGRVRVSAIDGGSVKLTDADTGIGTTLPLVKDGKEPS